MTKDIPTTPSASKDIKARPIPTRQEAGKYSEYGVNPLDDFIHVFQPCSLSDNKKTAHFRAWLQSAADQIAREAVEDYLEAADDF